MPEYLWVNNTRGIRRALSSRSGYTVVQTTGFSLPALDHLIARAARQHGATYIETFFRPRQLSLTVAIAGCNMKELQAKHRELVRVLNPLDDGELQVRAEDQTLYTLTCRPSTAIELQLLDSRVAEALIQLQADDPFFYTAEQTDGQFTSAISTGLRIPFTIPAKISSSTNEATGTVTNGGHILSWPVIQLATGFGIEIINPSIINDTTGQQLDLKTIITGGQLIEIDMGARTVLNVTTGENLLGTATGSFWPLEVGDNAIRVTAEGTDFFGMFVIHSDRFLVAV